MILKIKREDSGGLFEIPGHWCMAGVLDELLMDAVGGGQEVGSS